MALGNPAAVVLELMTMGQQSAAHLGDLLRAASPASPPWEHQELTAEIIRCCGRVVAALRATDGKKRKAVEREDAAASCSRPLVPPPKRRARGAEPLREVRSGTMVDGFIWRKYGQKDINGRKHPRLYYRCAYRHQGCTASRRVQRTQEPAAYEIAYYGEHTCRGAAACQGGAPPPTVVDSGSNAWGSVDANRGSPASEQWFRDSELSLGWWSPALSEVGFEAQTHEWHGTARVEEPSATPCYASDPVLEFLDGCFGWESVIHDPLQ
ncbi:transcription factor WRKY45-2-like [Phragmites australis]|uniref:transcription factor WRKY45-2-like n=1 Tax=Phragmites australis TaxID=29695 RepID=UPI002D778114|nr:transcription factor WRKY45-2-like [Phragmites australis]